MLKKTISLFEFDELPQVVKAEVIEKNRYINTDMVKWYSGIFEDFIEKAKQYGLYIDYDKILFSGFGSQGDGASFTCNDIDTDVLLDKFDIHFTNEEGIYKFKDDEVKNEFCQRVYFWIYRGNSRYVHRYTVESNYSVDEGGIDRETADYFHSVAQDICDKLDTLKNDLCCDLYGELEKEYFELISDKAVADSIRACEDLYFKNGALFTEGLVG